MIKEQLEAIKEILEREDIKEIIEQFKKLNEEHIKAVRKEQKNILAVPNTKEIKGD